MVQNKCDPCEVKLPKYAETSGSHHSELHLQWNSLGGRMSSGVMGEMLHFPQRTRWNSDLIQDGKSFVPDLNTECKLIAIFHSYFSVSQPTYILCLKAQTSRLQRSLKIEQDPPQVYSHMTHKGRQKYSVYGSCKRDLFFNQWLYLYTIFICCENKPAELRVRNWECTLCTQLKATAWCWESWRNKK